MVVNPSIMSFIVEENVPMTRAVSWGRFPLRGKHQPGGKCFSQEPILFCLVEIGVRADQ